MKRFIKITLIIFAILFGIWAGGLVSYYFIIPDSPTTDHRKTDAIIVLTGGKERIPEAFVLFNQGYATKLLITGVGKDTKELELINSLDLSHDILDNIDLSQIDFGYDATNTIENALEAKSWIDENRITSIRLITANYHMPRALKLFKDNMPQIYIIPHPVFPKDFKKEEWYKNKTTLRLLVREYNKYLATI